MRVTLDHKQLRLVRAWMGYGAQDEYGRFISLWVAFNALCYAKYAGEAYQQRADLDPKKSEGLSAVGDTPVRASGTVSRTAGRITLDLEEPGQVIIKIAEKYTEDVIFDRFAREYQDDYLSWLSDPIFQEAVQGLRRAIKKDAGYYIVNMIKAEKHRPDKVPYQKMKMDGIIVTWEDINKLGQLKRVLYQIRNNVFHGEKVPGDLNDDRIVRAASPVLRHICEQLVPGSTD